MVWNLYGGGVDGVSEERLHTQAKIIAGLEPDVLALPECTWWDEDEERRLLYMAHKLDLMPVGMVRSHIGDGRNHTTLLIRPSKLRLLGRRTLGEGVFHHALIRARLRPVAAGDDGSHDFLAFGTHFSWADGDSRLREARWLTDYGGEFPGVPPRAMLLGDLNIPDREPESWSLIPKNLHSRYRLVLGTGEFGGVDQRALQVLIKSGWVDPQTLTGQKRAATVGYFYDNERVPWCLDYGLVSGLKVTSYHTHDTPQARNASDHLPAVLDVEVGPST